MGSHWYRIYFIVFYLFAVLIGLNMIVAFIIDMFADQLMEKEHEEEQRNAHRGSHHHMILNLTDHDHKEFIKDYSNNRGLKPLGISMVAKNSVEEKEEHIGNLQELASESKRSMNAPSDLEERKLTRSPRKPRLGAGPRRIMLNSDPEFERRLEHRMHQEGLTRKQLQENDSPNGL